MLWGKTRSVNPGWGEGNALGVAYQLSHTGIHAGNKHGWGIRRYYQHALYGKVEYVLLLSLRRTSYFGLKRITFRVMYRVVQMVKYCKVRFSDSSASLFSQLGV